MSSLRWTVLLTSLLIAVPVASAAKTKLRLDSEPGDWVGTGKQRKLTPADGIFTASRNSDRGVTIDFLGDERWSLDFVAPHLEPLVFGPYEGATRYPFQSPSGPGLSVSGNGRGCSGLDGRFDVLEVEYGPAGEVLRFAADFEQRCEGREPALFGRVLFDSSGAPFLPPPDQDGDGVIDTLDNCVLASNAGQGDADFDRIGDACDPEFDATFFFFDSDKYDWVGSGARRTRTPADGTFEVSRNSDNGVTVEFNGDGADYWHLDFAAPNGEPLGPGPYEGATRFPLQPPIAPGLDVAGAGRGCSGSTGRFDVLEIAYGPGGEVLRFAADFEQQCDRITSTPVGPLVGRVAFEASAPPFPPPPDRDDDGVPDTLDNCVQDANAEQDDADSDGIGDACDPDFDVTFLYFDSEPGDYVGQGVRGTLTPSDGRFRVSRGAENVVSVYFDGYESWSLFFAGPKGQALAPGVLGGAKRYPFHSPTGFGLDVSRAGRGCNTLTGSFHILDVAYGPDDEVLRFAAEFEQHCDGFDAALVGSVRFEASPPTPGLAIDILPRNDPNTLDPERRRIVPVAVLGSETFDVTTVDVTSLAFGPRRAYPAHRGGPYQQDIDGDGRSDLLAHFRIDQSGVAFGDDQACVTGKRLDGRLLVACDDIWLVTSCGAGLELAVLLPPLIRLGRRCRRRGSAGGNSSMQ